MRQFESEEQVVSTEVHSNVGQLIHKLTENEFCYDEEWFQTLFSTPDPDSEGGESYLEPLEFWTVSHHLGNFLRDNGELVINDFGLWIWGRQTSGQRIALDRIIHVYATIYGKRQEKTVMERVLELTEDHEVEVNNKAVISARVDVKNQELVEDIGRSKLYRKPLSEVEDGYILSIY